MSEKQSALNPEIIHKNPLNNSTSKMLYSFSKTKRFAHKSKDDLPFYTLPDLNDKRTTAFGFGKKTAFEDKKGYPSPDKYNVSKEYSKQQKNGFSFGIGRSEIKADSMVVFKKSSVPGPGTYQPKPQSKARSASVRSRTKDHSLDQKYKVPGPGSYSVAISSQSGKTLNSKYQSGRCTLIARNKSSSLKKIDNSQYPSPCAYNPVIITRKGGKPVSKGNAAKFSLSRREAYVKYNTNPGPGQYASFSQFSK